jgi:hypothetical protein
VRAWYGRPLEADEPAVKPAGSLFNESQRPEADHGGPPIWVLNLVLQIHAQEVTSAGPDVQLDELVGQVEAALMRQPSEPGVRGGSEYGTSLGGLVFDCRIAGQVDFFSVAGTGAAMVEIPIEITVGPQ